MKIVRFGLAMLAWLLGTGALAATALAYGGGFSVRLDLLTHFAPLYMAAAALAMILGAVGPKAGRGALLLLSAAALVGGAALVGPEILSRRQEPRAPPGQPGEIKIIQFNAWGRNSRPDDAVRWMLQQDPDIIIIEEAGRVRDRLIRAGYKGSCLSCGAVLFAKTKPVRRYTEPPRQGYRSHLASATYVDALGEFTVVGVHRYWPVRFTRDRVQTRSLRRYMASLPSRRTILAGDFNSTPWSFARRREDRDLGLVRRTRALPTWPAAQLSHNRLPAPFPYMPIDHLYAGPGWRTVAVERGPELGSDHYPIVVTLAPVGSAVR